MSIVDSKSIQSNFLSIVTNSAKLIAPRRQEPPAGRGSSAPYYS